MIAAEIKCPELREGGQRCTQLQTLNLFGNCIQAAGAASLSAALPALKHLFTFDSKFMT